LAYTDQAHQNPPNLAFPPEDFTGGRISNPSRPSAPRPVTNTLTSADWIICAVNIRGQQRYRYGNYNGWCWDGASFRDIWNRNTWSALFPQGTVPPQQLSYFACRIDFQGSPGPAKRDQIPLGHFAGQPIYCKCSPGLISMKPLCILFNIVLQYTDCYQLFHYLAIERIEGPDTTITFDVPDEHLPEAARKMKEDIIRVSVSVHQGKLKSS
jgi:hypothetical protein